MSHQLDFINHEHIIKAIQQIKIDGVPNNHLWSEYWINYKNGLYQFKYVVEIAASFTKKSLQTNDFKSNDSSRNFIASLGFQIIFKSHGITNSSVNYWVGASLYGEMHKQKDMFEDFIKNKYWRADHNLKSVEGVKVYNELKKVKINDRLCIRYLYRRGGTIHIAAIGTVTNVAEIGNGKLGVIWDYNPPQFKGIKPSGTGAGNWWKTLLQLKRHSDITQIFGEILIEDRVARLTWNDNGWVMPSGFLGKSNNSDTHESKFGYGHEEWIFDTSKIINGFHYGFLEPIRKEQDSYSNKVYNVWLYCINGITKKRFWIGEIKNLYVLHREEADDIKQAYIKNGWFDEMEGQIKSVGGNEDGFSNWQGVDLFNIKFKIHDLFINESYFELPETHPIYELSRYNFSLYKDAYKIEAELQDDNFEFNSFTDNAQDDTAIKKKTYQRQPKAIEIAYLHRAISNSLTKELQKIYGEKNVRREHSAGYGANKIDIVARQDNRLVFYEIKTYNSIKSSIREAFGQLIEYCFYPDKNKANELIIVTQIPASKETRKYIQHLRNIFKLPIYYQSYDLETKTLSSKC